MKKKVWIFISGMVLIIVGVLIALFINRINSGLPELDDIESVTVTILDGYIDGDISFTCLESDNIMGIYKAHTALKVYKDEMIKSVKQDTIIKYQLENGTIKEFRLNGIRDIERYFVNVMNSDEYKKQSHKLFSIDADVILKIVVSDHYIDRDVKAVIMNEEEIEYLLKLSQEAVLENDINQDNFAVAYFDFYINDEVITHVVHREDQIIYNYMKEHSTLSTVLIGMDEIDYIIISDGNEGREINLYDNVDKEIVLNHFYDGYSSRNSVVSVEIVMNDSESRHWYGSFIKGDIPLELENWWQR